MSEADDFFEHKKVKNNEEKKKIKEETVEGEEWYLEDPDKKEDRVAFVRLHKDYEFKTKAS